jgi:hypothetical protein
MDVLAGLLAAVGAFSLSWQVGTLGYWPDQTANLAGRAILSAAGVAELAPQLAAFPPLPYLLLSLVELVAQPLGLSSVALTTALLAAALLVSIIRALRQAGFAMGAIIAFVLIYASNPLTLHSIVRGPQGMLLLCSVWMFGRGLFGFRTTGGVNALLALSLSLPLMALTSVRGAVIAVSAVPFLLLAVPPDLRQRADASTYLVLLFPLLFAGLFMMAIAAMLLQDPFGFVTVEMMETGRWSGRPWYRILAASIAVVLGCCVIAIGLILRARHRLPLQSAAGALLATLVLSVVLLAMFGIAESALQALSIAPTAAMVILVQWPREENRLLRTGALLLIGWLVASAFAVADGRPFRDPLALVVGRGPRMAAPTAPALGQWLAGKESVMIHALDHPEVVAARGSADGLVTIASPVFAVSLLSRRVFTEHVVLREHLPGISDDAISRAMPGLYRNGPPGYRLTYDAGGWRVWSRGAPPEDNQ